jgi:prepilin-type N-terminal cleavage/methylation domain-containing protein
LHTGKLNRFTTPKGRAFLSRRDDFQRSWSNRCKNLKNNPRRTMLICIGGVNESREVWAGRRFEFMKPPSDSLCKFKQGVSLIELLCVMAIIGILASLLLPVVSHVYRRAKAMAEEIEEPEVAARLRHEVRNYCATHAQYQFDSKADFESKCVLAPKCNAWIDNSATVFVPFNNLDFTNKVVVSFHYGLKHAYTEDFTKGELTILR